jgi:hypothetical protein
VVLWAVSFWDQLGVWLLPRLALSHSGLFPRLESVEKIFEQPELLLGGVSPKLLVENNIVAVTQEGC